MSSRKDYIVIPPNKVSIAQQDKTQACAMLFDKAETCRPSELGIHRIGVLNTHQVVEVNIDRTTGREFYHLEITKFGIQR